MKDIDRKWKAKEKAVELLTEIKPDSDSVNFYAEGDQMIEAYKEIKKLLRLKHPEEVFWILASAIEEKSRQDIYEGSVHPNALITGHYAVLAHTARFIGFDEGYACAKNIYQKKLLKYERNGHKKPARKGRK